MLHCQNVRVVFAYAWDCVLTWYELSLDFQTLAGHESHTTHAVRIDRPLSAVNTV